MTTVIGNSVAGQEWAHKMGLNRRGETAGGKMIGEQRQSVASGADFQQKEAERIDKIAAIIITKDRAALNAAYDDMMEEVGDIKAGLSEHAGSVAGV